MTASTQATWGAVGICRHVGGHPLHLGLRNVPTGGCFSRSEVPSAPHLSQAFNEEPRQSEVWRPLGSDLSSPLSRGGPSVLPAPPAVRRRLACPGLPQPYLCVPPCRLCQAQSWYLINIGSTRGERPFISSHSLFHTISTSKGGQPAWQFCQRQNFGICQNWGEESLFQV